MKSIFKQVVKSLLIFSFLFAMPVFANAANNFTPATEPVEKTVSGTQVLVANGTPIVIAEEEDGKTYAKWGTDGKLELTPTGIVVGGAHNTGASINYEKTSITMNSGKVGKIIGGNWVTGSNTDAYDHIKVGTVDIDINGGKVDKIFALTDGKTALQPKYYDTIKDFYMADTLNINVDNAEVGYIIVTSSYTYVNNLNINLNKAKLTDSYYALAIGSNGLINKATVNINDSTLPVISAGLRVMINEWTLDVTGNSVIGDVYAGSIYTAEEVADAKDNWSKLTEGQINYGQVGKMTMNFGKNVEYNNIYAGFQYLDKAAFATKFNNTTVAKGLANSETANLNITVASSPKVTDNGLTSMLNEHTKEYVSVTFVKDSEVAPIDPALPVEKPTVGVIDSDKAADVLDKEMANNSDVLDAIASGKDVALEIESKDTTKDQDIEDYVTANNDKLVIANYFDINVLIKNTADNTSLGAIEELQNKLTLSILLSDDLKDVKEGYVRKYYLVRNHGGDVTILDTVVSEDGKYISFESDKFSTYALAYEDVLDNVSENPSTGDNIMLYTAITAISLIGLALVVTKIKKENY